MKIIWRIKDRETMLLHAWPTVQLCLNTRRGGRAMLWSLKLKFVLYVCKLSNVLVTGLDEGQGGARFQ